MASQKLLRRLQAQAAASEELEPSCESFYMSAIEAVHRAPASVTPGSLPSHSFHADAISSDRRRILRDTGHFELGEDADTPDPALPIDDRPAFEPEEDVGTWSADGWFDLDDVGDGTEVTEEAEEHARRYTNSVRLAALMPCLAAWRVAAPDLTARRTSP